MAHWHAVVPTSPAHPTPTRPQGDPRASETFLLDNNILTVKVLCTCVSECQPQWGSPGVYRLSQQARVWWGTSAPTWSSSSPTGWGPRQLGSVNALSDDLTPRYSHSRRHHARRHIDSGQHPTQCLMAIDPGQVMPARSGWVK
ncbi:hypothetical protein Pmani_020460 [Petrolisthes manimaculis]|uniref:Uncharacterized protein n=1 Tax=Petrolisthes manimaculis TaxID=1843537 RepID=A0AAE1U4C2_9EUCA|nr:hypothetical protein Pmani_020460 [Petrolisthes manimaculis]